MALILDNISIDDLLAAGIGTNGLLFSVEILSRDLVIA